MPDSAKGSCPTRLAGLDSRALHNQLLSQTPSAPGVTEAEFSWHSVDSCRSTVKLDHVIWPHRRRTSIPSSFAASSIASESDFISEVAERVHPSIQDAPPIFPAVPPGPAAYQYHARPGPSAQPPLRAEPLAE